MGGTIQSRVTSSWGFTKEKNGKVTCDVNVHKPIGLLSERDIVDRTMDGFGAGMIWGAPVLPMFFVTGGVGAWIAYENAHEVNDDRAATNARLDRFFGETKEKMQEAGCDASNTRWDPDSRTE